MICKLFKHCINCRKKKTLPGAGAVCAAKNKVKHRSPPSMPAIVPLLVKYCKKIEE